MKDNTSTPLEEIRLSAPALRALHNAGYSNLEQLAKVREKDLKPLHGMGPSGIKSLREALSARGLAFADGKTAS